jgi:hypothetical protein
LTTPTQTRELCQRALESAQGIEITFQASEFQFGLDEARQEAQTLIRRIRAFRIKAKGFETIDVSLSASNNTYTVRIVPHAQSIPVKGQVRDIASGEVLQEFSETSSEVNAITYHLLRNIDKPEPPISPAQERLIWTHSPDAARDLYNAANWTPRVGPKFWNECLEEAELGDDEVADNHQSD